MKNYTNILSDYFTDLNYNKLPDIVITNIKNTLLDSIGMILAGVAYSIEHKENTVLNYVKSINDQLETTILGYSLKSSTRLSAFANGCMIELLDWQDSTIKEAGLHNENAFYDEARILERSRMIGYAIDARRQLFRTKHLPITNPYQDYIIRWFGQKQLRHR